MANGGLGPTWTQHGFPACLCLKSGELGFILKYGHSQSFRDAGFPKELDGSHKDLVSVEENMDFHLSHFVSKNCIMDR